MDKEPWWNRPFLIAPLFGVGFGLAIVPFAIAGVDHAAEFYGALVAALIAAGAVVGNAFLQAQLSRRQAEENRFHEMIVEALDLYSFMEMLARDFDFVAGIYGQVYREKQPLTVKNARQFVSLELRQRLRDRLLIAANVPKPLGAKLSDTLHRVDRVLDMVCYFSAYEETVTWIGRDLLKLHFIALDATKFIFWVGAELAQFLLANGMIPTLRDLDKQAIADGRPIQWKEPTTDAEWREAENEFAKEKK